MEKCRFSGLKMTNVYRQFVMLAIFAVIANTSKLPRQTGDVRVIRKPAIEYRGPVFIIKETDDINEPYTAFLVEGGIEKIPPLRRPPPSVHANFTMNETVSDDQEDPEYFAAHIAPDTITRAEISRTTTITIPLTLLLTGVSTRMPWILILKKQNHYHFYNSTETGLPILMYPQRRRYKRATALRRGRLHSGDKNYEMVYTEDDKAQIHGICTSIMREIMLLSEMLRSTSNEELDSNWLDTPVSSEINKNDAKVDKHIEEEYVVGTEFKVNR